MIEPIRALNRGQAFKIVLVSFKLFFSKEVRPFIYYINQLRNFCNLGRMAMRIYFFSKFEHSSFIKTNKFCFSGQQKGMPETTAVCR